MPTYTLHWTNNELASCMDLNVHCKLGQQQDGTVCHLNMHHVLDRVVREIQSD